MTDRKWWHPARHRDRRPFLLQRGQVRRALSDWFAREGFLEVECAALQVSPGNETHLHAFETEFRTDDGQVSPLYLHTSPEFSCKKLRSRHAFASKSHFGCSFILLTYRLTRSHHLSP